MRISPSWLFQGTEGATRPEIFRWWERRRLYYNLYVGIAGVITWWLVLIAGSAAVKSGVDFEEPIAMIVGPFVYGILANLCYSLGPTCDLVLYRGRPRVPLFKAGLIFSLMLTSLPGLWAVVAWLFTVHTGKKLD
jgi:hypothetical protein